MFIEYSDLAEIQYRKYANEFWKELTDVAWAKNRSFAFLPIVFTNDRIHNEEGNPTSGVTRTYINTATNISTIYPVISLHDDLSKTKIEEAIRHEVIHYLLGINYRCSADDSALFWLVCNCFTANAYLPMNERSKIIYDIAFSYIYNMFNLYQQTKQERIAMEFSMMLTVIDNAESDREPYYTDLEKYLKLSEDAANMNIG